MQRALKDGSIKLGFTEIPCAILRDGTRLITTSGVNKALGRANASGGKGGIDKLPPFLNVLALKPFISNELASSILPIQFQLVNGTKAFGYKAELLPMICEVFLKARDCPNILSDKQLRHAATADLIMRGLAKIGIIALIDEAVGYQEFRDKDFLQKQLDLYLTAEQAKWAKTFNDSFYECMFKLKGWNRPKQLRHKPHAVAPITNDLVYKRILPGLLDSLEERNPIMENGRRKSCHHQFLTKEQGLIHLKSHIFMLEKLMNASHTWDEFMDKTNQLLPYPNLENIEIKEIK